MRNFFAALLVLVVVILCSCAYADNMTFDSVTFNKDYKIKGYASVRLLGFKFVDAYAQWDDGKASAEQRDTGAVYDHNRNHVHSKKPTGGYGGPGNRIYTNASYKDSGNEAEFAWLKVDIVNLQKSEASFMNDISVKIIYDDEYEYEGWIRQFNYDFSKSEIYRYQSKTTIGWPVCLSPVDEMPIKPMYKGHYAFGCTLPNFVIEDKSAPLRMVITMDDHKLTYNIR